MRVRRTFTIMSAAVVAVVGMLTGTGPATAAGPPSPWTQTNYNAANSRANPAETTIGAGNVTTLRRQQTLTASRSAEGCPATVSTPVMGQSRLYAVVGDDLVSYDLGNGRLRWRQPVFADRGGVDYSFLAVSNGLVFVGTNTCATEDPLGIIKVYRSDTGAFVRTLTINGNTLFGMEIFGKYLVAQYGCPECNGDDQNVVYRVGTGSIVWQTPGDRALHNVSIGTSVVDGQVFELSVAADGLTTELHSYLAYNGAAKWTKTGSYRVLAGDSESASGNNLIVLGGDGALDLNPRTGATRFALPTITAISPALALDAKRIYATCSQDHQQICAYSSTSGKLLWQRADPGAAYNQVITVANDLVYLDGGAVLAAGTGAVVTTLSVHPVVVGSGRVGAYLDGPYLATKFGVYAPPAG